MSVGLIKRLLSIANLVTVLAIAGTAYGFLAHRSAMHEPWEAPDFVIPPKGTKQEATRIDNTAIRLGAFPEPAEAGDAAANKEAEVEVEKEIDKLGTIKGAIVVFEPYTNMWPALIFEYRVKPADLPKIVTIRHGQALITRPHSDPELRAWGDRENVRFCFVGCQRDKDDPDVVYFLFDIHCDGKEIQRARWKGETKVEGLPAARPGQKKEVGGHGIILDRKALADRPKAKPTTKPVDPDTGPKPVSPQPRPVRPTLTELRGPIFRSEKGSFAATEEGIAYLRQNHQKMLKDAYTTPYVDKDGKTRGVKIRAIKRELADQFGLLKDDVILAVNNRPVRSKTQAISVVKNELNVRKARFIEVKVLRLGATKILRFDTSDPATRRRAREGFRNRR